MDPGPAPRRGLSGVTGGDGRVAEPITIYGHALRDLWPLSPDITYLNHGAYGVTPKAVMAAADAWRARIEANPNNFLSRAYPALMRKSAAALAAFIGAAPEQVAPLGNATDGINAVLRSLDFREGDELVVPSVAYPAVTKAARYVAARTRAKLVIAEVPVPLPGADAAVAAFANVLNARTRLVIVDHVASYPAFVLPVRRIADAAHAAGARVLIDGAHAPGHVGLDVAATGADWYVGNCHKWLFAPRACGFLWAAPGTEAIHPLAISHGYGSGLAAEFDWTGTRDPAPFLSVPEAIAFHAGLGGAALMARNAKLAGEAAALLASVLQTSLGAPAEMFASMATVRMPARFGTTDDDAARIRARLSDEHRIEALIIRQSGLLLLRLAAQAYNELADYERLAEKLQRL